MSLLGSGQTQKANTRFSWPPSAISSRSLQAGKLNSLERAYVSLPDHGAIVRVEGVDALSGTITFTAFGTKFTSAFLPTFTLSPSRNSGISLLDCTVTRRVLVSV